MFKKSIYKKIISVSLALIMVLGTFPLDGKISFAEPPLETPEGFQLANPMNADNNIIAKYEGEGENKKLVITGHGLINRDKWKDMARNVDIYNYSEGNKYNNGNYMLHLYAWNNSEDFDIEFRKDNPSKIKLPADSSYLFTNFDRDIYFGDNVDTSDVNDMSYMFYKAEKFNQPIDFNTQNVTDMKHMFHLAFSFNQPTNFNTQNVTDMSNMFDSSIKFNQPINFNTQNVTNMSHMFGGASAFDSTVTLNDTSNVKDMSFMFASAYAFNKPIDFQTQSVTNMKRMFFDAKKFNKTIKFSNTSNVKDMSFMFARAYDFNQPIPFNTQSVTDMSHMFEGVADFDQPINFTNTSNVKDMSYMFANARFFNKPINLDTPNVTNMSYMFYKSHKFNNTINFNDTSKLTDISYMFAESLAFNKSIGFDTSNVKNMNHMFAKAYAFNKPININTQNVTDMSYMFANASVFNKPISFNTQNVTNMSHMFYNARKFKKSLTFTNTSNVKDMSFMFAETYGFNSPIDFDASSLTNASHMFENAVKFNSTVNLTNSSNVQDMSYMFAGTESFDNTITFDNTSNVQNMSYMFNEADAFNQPIDFNTQNVTNMSDMFNKAKLFNKPINFTNTSNVANMSFMFSEATAFNQPIDFNTQSVTDMCGMFNSARSFNGTINFVNTSNVTDMSYMFSNATSFNQPINFTSPNLRNISYMFENASSLEKPVTLSVDSLTNATELFSSSKVKQITLNNSTTGVYANRIFDGFNSAKHLEKLEFKGLTNISTFDGLSGDYIVRDLTGKTRILKNKEQTIDFTDNSHYKLYLKPSPPLPKVNITSSSAIAVHKTYGENLEQGDFSVSATYNNGDGIEIPVSGEIEFTPWDEVKERGVYTEHIEFKPTNDDYEYYFNDQTIPVNVTVGKAIYDGQNSHKLTYRNTSGRAISIDVRDYVKDDSRVISTSMGAITIADNSIKNVTLSNNKLNFIITSLVNTTTFKSISTIPVTFTSENYDDFTIDYLINIVDKDEPILTVDDISKTYDGNAIANDKIVGSASFEGNKVDGTFEFATDMTTVINAGTHTVNVKFTPTDTENYIDVTNPITVNIAKAVPQGEPEHSFRKGITFTLDDVNLSYGSILSNENPNTTPGAISWDEPANTEIQPNRYYAWTFTPTGIYATNYKELKGHIIFYSKKRKRREIEDEPFIPQLKVYFKDVPRANIYAKGVAYVKEHNLMAGVGNNMFAPNVQTTRGMLVTVLFTLSGENPVLNKAFTDIPKGSWYAKGANWASKFKITAGIGDGKFGGSNPLTKEQIITMLYTYAKHKGYDISARENISNFTDSKNISEYALIPMKWAQANGMLDNISMKTLDPQAPITRGELAMLIEQFVTAMGVEK